MEHIKHIFFDLDDTLWDFRVNSEQALSELWDEFQLKDKLGTEINNFLSAYRKINLELWSLYYKKTIDKTFMREQRFYEVFKKFGFDDRKESFRFSLAYLKLAPKGNALKPGCLEVLEYLSSKYKLHIITNGFIESQAIKMDGAGIRQYFSQVIISEEHSLVKPEIEVFRLAERLSGARPDESVMIGDSIESDMEGAASAGWDTILFCEDGCANYKGKKISELRELRAIF